MEPPMQDISSSARTGNPSGKRILGTMILSLGVVLSATGDANSEAATADTIKRCISDLAQVKQNIGVLVGGDHIFYNFERRVEQVERLCLEGYVGQGRDLLAEVKSDLRSLRGERGDR